MASIAAVYPHVPRETVPVLVNSVRELKNGWAMAEVLARIAAAMAKTRDHEGLTLTLDVEAALDYTWPGGLTLGRIGAAAATAGAPEIVSRALAALRQKAPGWRKVGGLALVAQALADQGKPVEARDLAREALDQARLNHDMNEMQLTVDAATLGLAYSRLGEVAAAETRADEAHEALSRIGSWDFRSDALNAVLTLAVALGAPDRFERLLPLAGPSAGEAPAGEVSAHWAVVLAKNGEGSRACAEAEAVARNPSASPTARGAAAAALSFADAGARAIEVAADAMLAARLVSREAVGSALEEMAPGLGHMRALDLLRQLDATHREVDGWWRTH